MILRHSLKVPASLAFFSLPVGHDKPTFEGNISREEFAAQNPINLYGMNGLKRMWSLSPEGAYSQELDTALYSGLYSFFLGGFYGVFKHGKEAQTRFLENNMGMKYVNEVDAKRYLVDNMALSALKGFAKYGTRVGFFVSVYTITASSVAVYRGKTGILDFAIGGFLAGGFYSFWQGPRAMVVGIGVGTLLGTISGTLFYLTMLSAGKSFEDLQRWQYGLIEERRKRANTTPPPDWQDLGQNALLVARKFDESKHIFKEPSSQDESTDALELARKQQETPSISKEPPPK